MPTKTPREAKRCNLEQAITAINDRLIDLPAAEDRQIELDQILRSCGDLGLYPSPKTRSDSRRTNQLTAREQHRRRVDALLAHTHDLTAQIMIDLATEEPNDDLMVELVARLRYIQKYLPRVAYR